METAKQINVYNKISRGEHVCRGDRLYSRDDMRKMLVDSGLSLKEIKMLYNLNAEAAFQEVSEIAGEKFSLVRPDEQIYFSNNSGWTLNRFFFLERTTGFFYILSTIQVILMVIVMLRVKISGVSQMAASAVLLIFVFWALSYFLAGAIVWCANKYYKRIAKWDATAPEDSARDHMNKVIKNRQFTMNAVCNTLHMYECMEDYIKANDLADVSPVDLVSTQVIEDDLK